MANFSIRTFLTKTPQELLKEYFTKKQILKDFDWSDEKWIDKLTELLGLEENEIVVLELARINDLADESGSEHILERAELLFDVDLADSLREMTQHQKAMWTYLYHRDIFREAVETEYIDNLTNWKICDVGCALPCETDDEIKKNFGKAIAEYYLKKGKGRHCEIDYYFRKNPDRHCFFAYPEDFLKEDLVYENGKRTTRAVRPAFEVIFIYDPSDGFLRTHVQRNGAFESLQDIFCKNILNLKDGVPNKNTQVYDLSPLKNANFRFTWQPSDGIEGVELKMLMLDLSGIGSKRVTVEAQPYAGNQRIVFDMMEKAMQTYGSDDKRTTIKKAKILIKFAPIAGSRRKRFTLNIGIPNTDNLKDDFYHNKVREVIKRWGFVRTLLQEAEAA